MASILSMADNDTTTGTGQRAEVLAAGFLKKRGLSVVARNFRCRGGEIDLICREGNTLVFVEVRLRRNTSFGGAGASITAHKRQRIILAAQHFLAATNAAASNCRFDCLLLDRLDERCIEWIRDAFSAD
jgi:putative endonuclease